MILNLGHILVAVLFGGMGFYLALIARFYRLKFHRGPNAGWLNAALLATVAGMLLRLDTLAFIPEWFPSVLMCAGGLSFTYLAFQLYRSMMHAQRRGEP